MADTSYPVVTGTDTSQSSKNIKLIDNGDNTYSQVVSVVNNGAVYQTVKDVTPLNFGNFYSFSVASGDFINFSRSSNGQQFTEVSMNPLSIGDEQTTIEYKTPFKIPCYAEIEASMSQRPKGQYAIMEITDKDASYLDNPIEYTFASLSQSATTLTAVINAPFDGYLGSWVDIYGLADNRFNYTNLCVASISTDKLTLTFTVSDENTLTSLTTSASVLTNGKLKRQAKLLLAGNALGMRFSGTSATATAYIARFGAGSIKESGTMTGAKTIISASSSPTFTSALTGQLELKASSRFRIEAEPEILVFGDKGIDTLVNLTPRNTFTAVKPSEESDYYVRFRAVTPKSISRPIAEIISAIKATATTTATITTDIPHGLTTSSYVTIKGIANQTVFANLTTPTVVASVINATQFTIVIGTATIATSYGGAVIMCNGQVDQQGIITQIPQSIARDATGLVTVVGNASWTGLNIGEYINLYGVKNIVSGADLGFDGVYKIDTISTTTLKLQPVKDLDGNLVLNGSGTAVTPVGGVVNTTNCGGIVILRTTLRSHDIVLANYTQTMTRILGQGSSRSDLAVPTILLGTATANINEITLVSPSTGTLTTAATTNATSLKATAGNLYAIAVSNMGASTIYLKLYNKASAPTVGTDIPILTIPITANSFYVQELGRTGIRFTTGIAYAITAALADTDTVAITAGNKLVISYI